MIIPSEVRNIKDQSLMANDDSNMSFPPISDGTRQSAHDADTDPDMRLGIYRHLFCKHLVIAYLHQI